MIFLGERIALNRWNSIAIDCVVTANTTLESSRRSVPPLLCYSVRLL